MDDFQKDEEKWANTIAGGHPGLSQSVQLAKAWTLIDYCILERGVEALGLWREGFWLETRIKKGMSKGQL